MDLVALDKKLKKNGGRISAETDLSGVKALTECIHLCKLASKVCLEYKQKDSALICVECAEICDLTVKFISCRSEFLRHVLNLCKLVCKRCEQECIKINDQHCQDCAKACKKSIDSFPKRIKIKK